MTPIQASKSVIEKVVNNNLTDKREIQKPKFKLGHLFERYSQKVIQQPIVTN